MSTKKKIKEDLNLSLKEEKSLEVSVLRQVLAAVLNKEKEKKFQTKEKGDLELAEEELIEVISSEAKKRKESIEAFEKGKRKDLAEKEKKELQVLEKYLPEQLSQQEIIQLVKDAIKKSKAEDIKEMGKIMAEIMPQIKGRADGGSVSKIVRDLLSN